MYQQLKDVAEKFDICISEDNFRKVGIHVQSGYCKIKGKKHFIMNKHSKIHEKVETLATFLSEQPHEELYLIPAVREVLNRSVKKGDDSDKSTPTPSTEQDQDPS